MSNRSKRGSDVALNRFSSRSRSAMPKPRKLVAQTSVKAINLTLDDGDDDDDEKENTGRVLYRAASSSSLLEASQAPEMRSVRKNFAKNLDDYTSFCSSKRFDGDLLKYLPRPRVSCIPVAAAVVAVPTANLPADGYVKRFPDVDVLMRNLHLVELIPAVQKFLLDSGIDFDSNNVVSALSHSFDAGDVSTDDRFLRFSMLTGLAVDKVCELLVSLDPNGDCTAVRMP
jgi:hypothetical protein